MGKKDGLGSLFTVLETVVQVIKNYVIAYVCEMFMENNRLL